MRSYSKIVPRENHHEKNLVADQPARVLLFSGVILALILGLSVRGITSPGKVRSMVAEAASKIHKDVTVTFSGAELSFHRGLLPRFAVIIHDVKMESTNDCWMQPQLMADEIRLPLSFWSMIEGANPITQVEAGQVELRLRSEYKNCETEKPPVVVEAPARKQFVTLKSATYGGPETAAPPPQVDAILIDQLRMSAPAFEESLDLSSFAIRLKSNSPRVIEMSANTNLIRDLQVKGDYLSHATIWSEYSEFPKKAIQARLSGNWREGSYEFNAKYFLKEEVLSSELELQHIPLSQLAQIFKKMQWLQADLNARQVWVSMRAEMNAKKADFKTADLLLRDLRLEGDLGDISSPLVQVTSMDPLRFQPFTLNIQRLSVEKLLALGNRPHPSPALGQLGKFTGTAQIADADHIEITGIHKGLEFIFANKGQRELQTLKEVTGKLVLQKDHWTLGIASFVPDQGSFDGDLQLQADRDFKNIEIKAKAKELILAPNVVRLMTSGGEVGAFAGDLDIKFQQGQMKFVKGSLSSDVIDVEGVKIEKTKLTLDSVNGELVSQAQAQKFSVAVGSTAFLVMKDLIDADWMSDDKLTLKNLTTQFHSKDLKNLGWRGFQASLERGGKISSDGAWDADGALSGFVQTKTNKTQNKWQIGGKRDSPLFTPNADAPSPNKRTKL
jgi:hypothetical protein